LLLPNNSYAFCYIEHVKEKKYAIQNIISTLILKFKPERAVSSQVPVAQAYNPSYPGSRDQEGSKPAQTNSS
jgi:hypothetical protein